MDVKIKYQNSLILKLLVFSLNMICYAFLKEKF